MPATAPSTDPVARIAALEATVELLQAETEELRADAAKARRRAERLRMELDVIIGSRLWRIAESIRGVARMITRKDGRIESAD